MPTHQPCCRGVFYAQYSHNQHPMSNMTHPSSAGVIASTFRPKRWKYHAVDPMAKAVAPAGRAFVFQDDAASAADEAEVEEGRYTPNWSAIESIEAREASGCVGCPIESVGEGLRELWAVMNVREPYRSSPAGSIAGCSADRARRTQCRARQHCDGSGST